MQCRHNLKALELSLNPATVPLPGLSPHTDTIVPLMIFGPSQVLSNTPYITGAIYEKIKLSYN